MPRTIIGSVGIKGDNLFDDTVTVQELLNGVSPKQGGPAPALEVDGKCGQKTRKAIQLFQLHHFGWSGADGRVDPGHRTIAKLNELNPEPELPKPAEVPPNPEPLSTDFAIVPSFQGDRFPKNRSSTHFTYLIIDITHNRERLYQLQLGDLAGVADPAKQGFFSRFKSKKPTTASGFIGIGAYMTSQHGNDISSKLLLFPPQGGSGISIPMKTHLFDKMPNLGQGSATTAVNGAFVMIR
jgi:hypothetical protein